MNVEMVYLVAIRFAQISTVQRVDMNAFVKVDITLIMINTPV